MIQANPTKSVNENGVPRNNNEERVAETGSRVPINVALTGPISPTPQEQGEGGYRANQDNKGNRKDSGRIEVHGNLPGTQADCQHDAADEHTQCIDGKSTPFTDLFVWQDRVQNRADSGADAPEESLRGDDHSLYLATCGNEENSG